MAERLGKKNYFLFEDLIELLQEVTFQEDTEDTLMQALLDLDDDGDGFIPKEEMMNYLTSMGEAFSQDEIKDFLAYATKAQPKEDLKVFTKEKETYDRNGRECTRIKKKEKAYTPEEMIDLKLLCSVMMPRMNTREDILKAASAEVSLNNSRLSS